jgi:NAD(P)H-hydrate epimerase
MSIQHSFHGSRKLVSAEDAQALDSEASLSWGLNPFALVEAAGRSCAQVLVNNYPGFFSGSPPRVVAAAGSGNNAADALVMLRVLIVSGYSAASLSAVVINHIPADTERNPRAEAFRSVKAMNVPILVWDGDAGEAAGRASEDIFAQADIIIDGIAGTGLKGALGKEAKEMVEAVNALKTFPEDGETPQKPFVAAIDIPSGNSGSWAAGMPILKADATLAIEPEKLCLYTPATRSFAGTILPVRAIFPPQLINSFKGAELVDWRSAASGFPCIQANTHKYERGLVEIRAGSKGSAGAAKIAARGAQAAGAGLIRLIVDDDIYPVLASQAGGIMVAPVEDGGVSGRFTPDAILLGPGWGTQKNRAQVLKNAILREQTGTPLILDADAITLARGLSFHGNAILTPHPGEFEALSGIPKGEILARPGPILAETAAKMKAVILFKSHVLIVAGADGRLGFIDGMAPVLAAGGSGDLLAGFCVAIAARAKRRDLKFDGYACAAAAAALIIESAKSPEFARRFTDPLELADKAAELAGAVWLNSGA